MLNRVKYVYIDLVRISHKPESLAGDTLQSLAFLVESFKKFPYTLKGLLKKWITYLDH